MEYIRFEQTGLKVSLIANCLLNQNAKVCEGARYRGVVSPVVEALLSRGYRLQQLPCPELAFAGVRRWWAVYEQYDTPAYRAHCRPPGGHWTWAASMRPARAVT
jgi:predicted secreted protein